MLKKLGKILFIVLLIAVPLSLVSCDKIKRSDTWHKIEKSGKIIVGVAEDFPPMVYRVQNGDDKGKLHGFDISLAIAIANTLGVETEIKIIEWDNKENELNNGNIDIICSALSITEERKTAIDFSQPYVKNKQVLISKDKISPSDNILSGKIAMQASSSALSIRNCDKLSKCELIELDGGETLKNALISDSVNGIILDDLTFQFYKNNSAFDSSAFRVLDLFEENYAIGIRKDDTVLKTKINESLLSLKTSGELKVMSKIWFNEDYITF